MRVIIAGSRTIIAADALIAVWDGKSRGTAHVVGEAMVFPIPVYVVTWNS